MGYHMMTLAADVPLVSSYHKLMDPILNSTAGKVIVNVMAAGAVICTLGLIFGFMFKMLQRPNMLSNTFCASGGRVLVVLVVIFILAGPKWAIPGIFTMIEWFANMMGNQGMDYLKS